jgi:Fic-DOC domain mobile mystery protein B
VGIVADSAQPEGSTPIDPEEAEELIPDHIQTQSDLNEWEQANILRGRAWGLKRRRNTLLTEGFVKTLHYQMFDDTWKWAGRYRTSDKTIGTVPWYDVPSSVRNVCADASLWLTEAVFPLEELAVRLHHRLVQVHPFPNGNGRHARLMADLFIYYQGGEPLTWGSNNLQIAGGVRSDYIKALQQADAGNLVPLLRFAQS